MSLQERADILGHLPVTLHEIARHAVVVKAELQARRVDVLPGFVERAGHRGAVTKRRKGTNADLGNIAGQVLQTAQIVVG